MNLPPLMLRAGERVKSIPLGAGWRVKSVTVRLIRMKLYPSKLDEEWFFLGLSRGLRPWDSPLKNHSSPRLDG